jgi:hypothetical protein
VAGLTILRIRGEKMSKVQKLQSSNQTSASGMNDMSTGNLAMVAGNRGPSNKINFGEGEGEGEEEEGDNIIQASQQNPMNTMFKSQDE